MDEIEQEVVANPDFSELPNVVWIQVLKYLSLNDRASVSETCHLLYDVYINPSLWVIQKFHFMGDTDNMTRRTQTLASVQNYVELTKRFGQYFQHLTIEVSGHFRDIPIDLQTVLKEVAQKCRLETLTIYAGKLTSEFHEAYGFPPENNAVQVLTAFVKHAFRMKHLHIRSWPMFKRINQQECNVFVALKENMKLRSKLKTLTLFCVEKHEWSEREPILLSHAFTLDLLNCFKNLTTIGLRSPMVTQELLELLAQPDRTQLQLLKIFVHYLDPKRKPAFRIPYIHARAWQSLLHRSLTFRVECTILLNTPDLELSNMLTPEVPLSALVYMKYSKIDPVTLGKVFTHYHLTLTKFHSYCDSYNIDEELIQLSSACKNLEEFVYHGEINISSVIFIAKTKGTLWQIFEVKEQNIKLPDEFEDVDEDHVIARQPDGQLVQVELMRFHISETSRHEAIQSMMMEVSQLLGKPWKPVN